MLNICKSYAALFIPSRHLHHAPDVLTIWCSIHRAIISDTFPITFVQLLSKVLRNIPGQVYKMLCWCSWNLQIDLSSNLQAKDRMAPTKFWARLQDCASHALFPRRFSRRVLCIFRYWNASFCDDPKLLFCDANPSYRILRTSSHESGSGLRSSISSAFSSSPNVDWSLPPSPLLST